MRGMMKPSRSILVQLSISLIFFLSAGCNTRRTIEADVEGTQQQQTSKLLSQAQRGKINRAFSRASWQSLEQTWPESGRRSHPRAPSRRRKVQGAVAKLQNLLGTADLLSRADNWRERQAAENRREHQADLEPVFDSKAMTSVYRPYGDQWQGHKSVFNWGGEWDGDIPQSVLEKQNVAAGASQSAEPAAAYSQLPPCNAGGGAVVFSSNCAPYPYGGLPLYQTGGGTGGPFGAESSPQV